MFGFRSCKKTKYHKLAIIGNGFDLAHNYKTLYSSFANNTSSPALNKFKSLCKDEVTINTWYDFENNINILTQSLFIQSYSEKCDYTENRNNLSELNELFSEISDLLSAYLRKELSSKKFKKIQSIANHLDTKTIAINFNYTDTAKNYLRDVINIHGSLSENDIILGYDCRDEACLAQYEDMCWSKKLCRESLAFRRFLRKRKLFINPKKQELLISALESYHHHENTGRGIDREMHKDIPSYHFINWFVSRQRRRSVIDRINYSEITSLIILGHGIEADRILIDSIASKCVKLSEIIIYRYENESDEEFDRKKDFLKSYCKNIKEIYY